MKNTCTQDLRELLPWYVNGTLTSYERARVEAHLVLCMNCKRELSELQGLKAVITEITESLVEPSEKLFERAIERIHSGERHTIAQVNWQLFALGFSLGVLYERGRVKLESEIDALGWKLTRKG